MSHNVHYLTNSSCTGKLSNILALHSGLAPSQMRF